MGQIMPFAPKSSRTANNGCNLIYQTNFGDFVPAIFRTRRSLRDTNVHSLLSPEIKQVFAVS